MCFTAQNRSYTVKSEHFMNLKSFIWNWSLNDSFYLPGLLAIPFKCLNENKEGQCCHISRFQWTPQRLGGQRTDLVSGPLEGRSSEDGRAQEKARLWTGRAAALAGWNGVRPRPTGMPFSPSVLVGGGRWEALISVAMTNSSPLSPLPKTTNPVSLSRKLTTIFLWSEFPSPHGFPLWELLRQ